ncbi:RasGEF domain-containing protein [Legionella hackeliae]|uniref:Ras-GEF domain-containing protein n=1 Tax=Legionella hackeliae TaxID=449 RepID=A0A0A8UP32_LEGHA|nr:RasGEF domain-containing protein [Legionella hackeliae]KTD13807.1 RasGEF domain protein [Legionella hackeliae]CEK10508.1 protein of unknown function [RasGEF domain] [Legionella hackeliae]STX47245.1 RasGEF domain [Legionella hackeliae]
MSYLNLFNWVKSFTFLLEPFPIVTMDSNSSVKSLSPLTNQENPKKLSKEDKAVALDQAKIIDNKLRKAFTKLTTADFADPSGFADFNKSSTKVKEYLHVQKILEFYMKNSIEQHKQRSMQIRAFQRWIETANYLRRQQCYEGAMFVATTLLRLNVDLKLTAELPKAYQKKFEALMEMVSPFKNFGNLRKEIKAAKSTKKFLPISLKTKDLTHLNELLNVDVSNEVKTPFFKSKIAILKDIKNEQQEGPALSIELESAYQRVKVKYENEFRGEIDITGKAKVDSTSEVNILSAGNPNPNYRVMRVRSEKTTRIYFYNDHHTFWQRESNEVTLEQATDQPSKNLAF